MHILEPLDLPTPADVIKAGERLRGQVLHTPLLESAVVNDRISGRLFIKPESLQLTGAFKVRGAFNRLLVMSAEDRARGIVAWSAGNHAQALAFVGQRLGVAATIVMPSDAPKAKVMGTHRFGAKIVFYDRQTEDREAIGKAIAAENGAIIVPPYEDKHIIAGGGTAALELIDDTAMHGVMLDRIVVCVGGGGLIAGCGLAAKARESKAQIMAAEPVHFDDTRKSLMAGVRVTNDLSQTSIADALLTTTPGEMTFALNQHLVHGAYAVSDDDICTAMITAFDDFRLVTEPGGVASLAALLSNINDFSGLNTGVIITGGNVDPARFSAIIGGAS
jgi:threonine dehydratase